MQTAEFVFDDEESVIKKFPASGLRPSFLAKAFRLVESSMDLLSDEGEYFRPEDGIFVPPLSKTAKKFIIYGDRIPTAIPQNDIATVMQREATTLASPLNPTTISGTLSQRTITYSETKDEISKIIRNTCDIRQSVQLLSSLPQTCLLLDSVQIIMSCTEDVTLEVDTEEYDCLKKSTTFKAALLRCTNEIRDTFFNCGLAMNQMQNMTSTLPSDFACLISVVANPSNPDLKLILDLACESIRDASTDLVKVSEDITNQINHAQEHLKQIIEVAIEAEHAHNTDTKEKTKQYNSCSEKKRELNNIQQLNKQQYKTQITHRDKVYKNYSEQLQNYQAPTYVETAFQLTGDALSGINDAISSVISNTTSAAKSVYSSLPFANEFTASHEAREISEKSLISLLSTIRNEAFENLSVLDENIMRYITFLKVHTRYKPSTTAGKETQKLAERLQKFFHKLRTDSANLKPSEILKEEPLNSEFNELKALMDATLSIVNEVKKIQTDKKEANKKMQEQRNLTKEQKRQRLEDAKKYALDLAKELYQKENDRAEQIRQKMNSDQENIMQIAAQMATLDLETLELKDVIKSLKDAKRTLICIQTSWNAILQFFKTVKANIDGQFSKNLTKLLSHTDLYTQVENKELLPLIVKTMMMTIGSCVQFGHCAEIYAEILTDHAMPIMNDMTSSMFIDKDHAQKRQKELEPKILRLKKEIENLIKDRTTKNETKEVPKILNAFAVNCYQRLEMDYQKEIFDKELCQPNVVYQILTYLKLK